MSGWTYYGYRGSIGDMVFLDANGNGLFDPGESGVSGVRVDLYASNGTYLTSTLTDGAGGYVFDGLYAGSYRVKFHAPDDFKFVQADAGDDLRDSDANPLNGVTGAIHLDSGQHITDVDAGLMRLTPTPGTGSIGDRVWLDLDGDGRQELGERGVAGVRVDLFTSSGVLLDTTETDAGGRYLFDDLDAGNYRVKFFKPDGTEFTTQDAGPDGVDSDPNPLNGVTGVIRLDAGQDIKNVDAGLIEAGPVYGSIGDKVFYDIDCDGIQDAGEYGVEGVKVSLFLAGGTFLQTTVTDADGMYTFEHVERGDYRVRFYAPDDYMFTEQDAGPDDRDSDANATTGVTDKVWLDAGEHRTDVDAGLKHKPPEAVAAIDIEKLVRLEDATPTQSGDLCEVASKPASLTFSYNGSGSTVSTDQDSSKATANGDPAGDPSVYIVAGNKDFNNILFAGTVALGEEFVLDGAGSDRGKFDSETRINIFDSEGGTLLQSLSYHTSCSQPIQLGDVIGSVTLTGYNGVDGEVFALDPPDLGPNVGDADADVPADAVEGDAGDVAVFTYVVTNPGEAAIANVVVVDDNETPFDPSDDFAPDAILTGGGFNVGDLNADGLLDVGEQWLYVGSETADVGVHLNVARVTGEYDGQELTDEDPAIYSVDPGAPQSGDLCEDGGKPQTLTFLYTGADDDVNNTAQDSSKAVAVGDVNDDPSVYIVAAGKGKFENGQLDIDPNKLLFEGDVDLGETFILDGAGSGAGKFESETTVFIFDEEGGALLQSIKYHTSCSQPIQLGDAIGAITLTAYNGEDASFVLPLNDGADLDALAAAFPASGQLPSAAGVVAPAGLAGDDWVALIGAGQVTDDGFAFV